MQTVVAMCTGEGQGVVRTAHMGQVASGPAERRTHMMSFCLATSGTSMVTVCSRRSAPQQISRVSSLGRSRGLLHQFMASPSPWQVRGLRPCDQNYVQLLGAAEISRNQRSEMGSVSRILSNRLSAVSLPGSAGHADSSGTPQSGPQRRGWEMLTSGTWFLRTVYYPYMFMNVVRSLRGTAGLY